MLVLCCLPLHTALTRAKLSAWLWFFLWTALVVNLRNVFHLVWWLALVGLALRIAVRRRLGVLMMAIGPLCLASCWYAKNLCVFGRFEASSWIGFGLARKTWQAESVANRQALVRAGTLDPIAGVPLYGTVAEYAEVLGMPPPSGVPLLDRPTKPTGHSNFHHAIYATASLRMRDEALRVIAALPGRYLANVAVTARQLFAPAVDWPPVVTVRAQVACYEGPVDVLLHGEWGLAGVSLWSVLATLILVPGVVISVRALARPSSARPTDRMLVIMVATILYLYAVAVLLETNEVMRLRLKGDGMLMLAGVVLTCRRPVRDPGAMRPHE